MSGYESSSSNNDLEESPTHLFFSTGRAALKFYLSELCKRNKNTIAMQSFNCRVVADAALEAGCQIFLMDISREDCSVSLSSVKELPKSIDILLLTHYQGLPNKDYIEIAKYCNDNEILLIEDLAHVYEDSTKERKLGRLSTANIYSYAFDKPISCYEGGMLELIVADEFISKSYETLSLEDERKAQLDLSTHNFLYTYTSEKYYYPSVNNVGYVRKMIAAGISHKVIYSSSKLLINKYVRAVFNKLMRSSSKMPIDTLKLHPLKRELLFQQMNQFNYQDQEKVTHLLELCKNVGVIPFNRSESTQWNRLSVLDPKFKLRELLTRNAVEVSNFNWPLPLHQLYADNPNVIGTVGFSNSELFANQILNIPLWSDEILKIEG
jgi:dTDP-4-amino-4,6-dideoxygalactose transaminase